LLQSWLVEDEETGGVMTTRWPQQTSGALIRAHQSPLEPESTPSAARPRHATLERPPRSVGLLTAAPTQRADSALWCDIQASVTEYCDERARAGDWHINRDPFGSDVLAFNFFFPLRLDNTGMSLALTTLRGSRTHLESLDVLPPTMVVSPSPARSRRRGTPTRWSSV
jgi:hypothetical protein